MLLGSLICKQGGGNVQRNSSDGPEPRDSAATSTLERNSTSLPYDVLVGIAVIRSTGPGGMHKYSSINVVFSDFTAHTCAI